MNRYRENPRPAGGLTYAGPESIEAVGAIALKKDSSAKLGFVPEFEALLVRTFDERGNPDYEVVEHGQLLVYSAGWDVLYAIARLSSIRPTS